MLVLRARGRACLLGREAKAAWIGPGGGVCDSLRCLQRACAAHRKSQPQLRDHKPSCGSRISGATASLLQIETWLSLSIQSKTVHRIGTAARDAILSH